LRPSPHAPLPLDQVGPGLEQKRSLGAPATLHFLSLQHAPLSRQTPQIQQVHTAPQPETRPAALYLLTSGYG